MPTEDGMTALSDREFYELKNEAAEYYAKNNVPEKLEEILNSMFYEKPEDVYGRLSNHFEAMALPARISKLQACNVMDSTGNPAISCNVLCTIKNEDKVLSSSNLSVASELLLLPIPQPESGEKEPTKESIVSNSITFIESHLSDKLKGICPMEQKEIDSILRKWIDDEEDNAKPTIEGEEAPRTPTPSSGVKKKPPSGKGKGKPSDKPVPPFEQPAFQLQGGSAVASTSIAVLQAAAKFLEKPTFEHFHNITNQTESITFPVPSINIFTGGKSSPGKLNIAKSLFVIAKPDITMEESIRTLTNLFHQVGKILSAKGPAPLGATGGFQPSFEKIEQPLDLIQEAATALGISSGQDVFIGIDCAAHETFDYGKGKYEIMTGVLKSADEIVDFYRDIIAKYPAIITLIDPLRKEDREQWPKCCEMLSEKCYILGSDSIYGSTHTVNESALEKRPSSGLVITPGGRVTLTDMVEATKIVHDKQGVTILTPPLGDVCNPVFSDLAVGMNCDIVKFGSPCRGETTQRLNRMIEIEKYLKDSDISFSYQQKFTFPHIRPPTPPAETEDPSPSSVTDTSDQKSKKK